MIHQMTEKRICLIGVKGVGKTTLIKSILKKIPNIDYIIGSIVLRKLVILDNKDFNNFDYFEESVKEDYRKKAIKYMIRRQQKLKKSILVDGHTSLYNPSSGSIDKVFTKFDCGFYTDLILLETSKEIIFKRRKKDKSKKRILDINLIENEILGERRIAQQISVENSMNFLIINENNYRTSDELQKALIRILKNY